MNVLQESQITERFTRAIDQLGATDKDGNPSLEIRLGGIYALEQIMKDAPDKYHWTVLEVLTAYVRKNSPKPTDPETVMPAGLDIQAIATVISRRNQNIAEPSGLNFIRVNLNDANLRRAKLIVANLSEANLSGANLAEANLNWANLRVANLGGAILAGANFSLACLIMADLQYAELYNAALRGADLSGADLRWAKSLTQEQISGAAGNEQTKLPEGLERPEHWTSGY